VTGQQGAFRYGVLAAKENDTKLSGTLNGSPYEVFQTGREFSVARLMYEHVGEGGRRAIGWLGTNVTHSQREARSQGVDLHYLAASGRWEADGQLLYSDLNGVSDSGFFADFRYRPSQGVRHEFAIDYFGDQLDINDLGFLRRNDVMALRYSWNLSKSSTTRFKTVDTRLFIGRDKNLDGRTVRGGVFFRQNLQFYNNSKMGWDFNYFPERWEDRNSDGNGSYRIRDRINGGISWQSDSSKDLSWSAGTEFRQSEQEKTWFDYRVNLNWQPSDRFNLELNLRYFDRKSWLIHSTGRELTTYHAADWRPRLSMGFFLSAKQQFRISAEWVGIDAKEEKRWLIPAGDGWLQPLTRPAGTNPRAFTISRMSFQARYRWEIAPLSDLFIVYTRASDVPSDPTDELSSLLSRAWSEPVIDFLVIKLRYRLGS